MGVAVLVLASVGIGQAGPAAADTCRVFPADNAWNQRVDTLPVHPSSTEWVKSIGETERLRALFSATDGISYQLVAGSTAPARVTIVRNGESDPGPYRLRDDTPIEDDTGRVLVLDRDRCLLAEMSGAVRTGTSTWTATAGAVFDLGSNDLRPDGWASADQAGLPIYPGLARFDEVERGAINHALRFSAPQIGGRHYWPARRDGDGGIDPSLPPAGTRFRLRSIVNPAGFSPRARVILTALQKYGMLLAEPGPAWGLSGAPDPGWDEASLAELEEVFCASFEAVDVSSMVIDGGSGQAIPPPTPVPPGTPGPTSTPAPTKTPLPTTTPEPTPTVTFTPSPEPTETPKPTRTPRPTATKTPTITNTPTNTPTITNTPLPTNTPTVTLTPTVTPVSACRPERPYFNSYQIPLHPNGIARITVTIESNGGSGIGRNSLNIISVSDIENARVDINGEILDDLGEEVILDDETDAVDIDVERINPDTPFRVAFMVIDECNGPFYTRPFGGPAQPTPTPTSTSTPTP